MTITRSQLPALSAAFKTAVAARVEPLQREIETLKSALAAVAPLQSEIAVLKARLEERPSPKDGAPGKDAPPVDTEALFLRLKAELPAMIPAPIKGDPGEPGKDAVPLDEDAIVARVRALIPDPKDGTPGTPGKDAPVIDEAALAERVRKMIPTPQNGVDGKDGASVDPLVVRAMIREEALAIVKEIPPPRDGKDGKDGRDGRDGTAGENGRDAAALEFVTLDESKSYPRGTFGLHKGGIWYAERATEALDGWRLIASGIAGAKAELLSDGRTFEFTFERSDGSKETSRVKAAIPGHAGVWREAVTYEKGDIVQWSGNAWIAREVTDKKPGDDKAWELMARRGRDGKDTA